MEMTVQKQLDMTNQLKEITMQLLEKELKIGILDNPVAASHAYITEFGEPLLNQPSNPFMINGVEESYENNRNSFQERLLDVYKFKEGAVQVWFETMGKEITKDLKEEVSDNEISDNLDWEIKTNGA